MSDVKDILGLAPTVTSSAVQDPVSLLKSSSSKPIKPPAPKKKRVTSKNASLKRELTALTKGWEAHGGSIAPTFDLKQGLAAKRTNNVHWKLETIRSSARRQITGKSVDDLELRHWVMIHKLPDYRFAKFHKPVKMLRYDDNEYQAYCQHPLWSRAETDRLFDLCDRFDLRFIVIHDRFISEASSPPPPPVVPPSSSFSPSSSASSSSTSASPPPTHTAMDEDFKQEPATGRGRRKAQRTVYAERRVKASADVPAAERTVEDLKDRFYAIQRALMLARNSSDPELGRHPSIKNPYDPVYETERKLQLEKLFKRDKESVTEMAQAVLENRALHAALKKANKANPKAKSSRKASAAATASAAANVPSTPTTTATTTAMQPPPPPSPAETGRGKKRKATAAASPSPAPASSSSSASASSSLPPGGLASIPDECVPRDMFKLRGPGCYLRSSQITAPLTLTSRQQKQLDSELSSLSFKKNNITVPTSAVCNTYDKLRMDIVTLHNLQRYVKKRESDLGLTSSRY